MSTWQDLADLLRECDFAMSEASTAIVAFVPADNHPEHFERVCARLHHTRHAVHDTLRDLPGSRPLTAQQEDEAKATALRALDGLA